jgi:hypothetical protein
MQLWAEGKVDEGAMFNFKDQLKEYSIGLRALLKKSGFDSVGHSVNHL